MTTAAPKLKWREVPISQIDIPKEYVRKTPNEDADKALAESVKLSGVHQPLAVVPAFAKATAGKPERFLLVKGTRRLAAAEENGIEKVPVVVNYPPAVTMGKALKAYRDRLRFILDSKRQDLTPSQEVAVIEEAQRTFKLNNKEIAALLGWDPATVTNKKRIEHYAKPIVAAIDRGDITLHHAESFLGMKPAGQIRAFAELKDQLPHLSGRRMRALVTKRFDPKRHADLWIEPKKAAEKIADRPAKRRRLIQARQSTFTAKDRERLENDLDLTETELKENEEELKRANLLLRLVGPIHRAVSNDGELLDYVATRWPEHVMALEAFSEKGY